MRARTHCLFQFCRIVQEMDPFPSPVHCFLPMRKGALVNSNTPPEIQALPGPLDCIKMSTYFLAACRM